MKRFLTVALLLAFAAPLSGCGISGSLKTPPPIWGDAKLDTATAQSDELTDEAATTPTDNALDSQDEDEIGYGVDVADTP